MQRQLRYSLSKVSSRATTLPSAEATTAFSGLPGKCLRGERKKIDHQQIKHNRRPRQQRDKPWQTAQKNPSRDIDYQQSQQKDYQYVGTFAVNFDSHCSIEIPMKPRACGKKAGKLLKKVGVYQLMLRCSHSVALKYKVSVFFLKPRHFRCQTGIFYRYGFNIRHNPPTGSL